MVRGLARDGVGVQRLVNHRLTHCLGGAVSRWVQSMHRFSTLNNSTIRDRVPRTKETRPRFRGHPSLYAKQQIDVSMKALEEISSLAITAPRSGRCNGGYKRESFPTFSLSLF